MKNMRANVMKKAWEMYKAAGCTMRAEFSIALKMAWADAKIEILEDRIQELEYADRMRYDEKREWYRLRDEVNRLKYRSTLTVKAKPEETVEEYETVKVDVKPLEAVNHEYSDEDKALFSSIMGLLIKTA